jgi:hypothetical protein
VHLTKEDLSALGGFCVRGDHQDLAVPLNLNFASQRLESLYGCNAVTRIIHQHFYFSLSAPRFKDRFCAFKRCFFCQVPSGSRGDAACVGR